MNFLYLLAQLAVLVMGVMAGVRGSLAVTGSWTLTGWPARLIGWSFVVAAAWSLSWPGLLFAPDFEPQTTTIQALAPALGPYLLALTVTAAVLVRTRKHHGSVMGIMALVIGTLVSAPMLSYAGGSVIGTVAYGGMAEEKEFFFKHSLSPKFCRKIGTDGRKPDLVRGDKRIFKTIEVSKDGALNAAVVAVTDIEDSVWMDGYKGTEMLVTFCEFLPYTGVVVNQRNLHVENTDPVLEDDQKLMKFAPHYAHSFEMKGSVRTIFNIGLAAKGENGSTLDRKILLRKENQGSVLRLGCDIHEWEQAFFLPVRNPHYAVTGADGNFTIENVPAGKHKIIAWHPFAGRVEADVEVKEGATVTANFQIKK